MAFSVDVEVREDFEASCTGDQAFALLSDVPESLSHFPKVDQLVDLGDGKYRTEMQKIGIDKYNIQTIYACKYVSDAEKNTVKWTPVKGEGNGTVSGKWTIKDTATGCHVKFETKGSLEVPLPALVKIVIAPIVRREFEGLIDQYLNNLQRTLNATPAASRKTAAKKAPAKKAATGQAPAKKSPAKGAQGKK